LTSTGTACSSAVSPKFQPALKAAMFASRICGLEANFSSSHSSVLSTGRPYIHETTPRAKRFFARAACVVVTPSIPFVAATVSEVMGTRKTL
jgi:hypothetical protein